MRWGVCWAESRSCRTSSRRGVIVPLEHLHWGRWAAHRRQAGSHRYSTGLRHSGFLVGAGLPAIGGEAPAWE
ncbi:hypothetical protein DVB73_09910 [Pseudomonas plecoglossicida]|uniref:Uncharacterized protein n=1 Tax=Pseudomonas plecoglossicida TaxID=70775 RepID=A0AAD0QUX6_PSEDL|nr:hypothetical protein DVB73_09910 [Pseudomonas plecoglossicida]